MVAALAGCGGPDEITCLPPGAVEATPQATGAAVTTGPAAFYLDVSLSMQGFAAGARQGSPSLAELLHVLPDVLRDVAGETSFHAFGDNMAPDSADLLKQAAIPGFYSDHPFRRDGNIALPLAAANAAPAETLSIIVTDLFLSGTDWPETGASPLRRPLAEAIRSGRSVGIVGLEMLFDGRVHDLPTTPDSLDLKGSRALFLLLVGPADRIAAFHRALQRDLRAGRQLFLQFVRWDQQPPTLSVGPEGAERRGADVQSGRNLVLVSPQPLSFRLGPGPANEVHLPLVAASPSVPGLPVIEAVDVRETLYSHRSSRSCPDGWQTYELNADLAAADGNGAIQLFGDPQQMANVARNRTFLLRLEVHATKLGTGPALGEALAGWTMSLAEARDRVAAMRRGEAGEAMFPALNLDRMTAVLAETAVDGAEKVPLSQIDIAFIRE